MRMLHRPVISFILLLTFLWPQGAALAQQPVESLKVGVFVNPPFVMNKDGRYTGMAVEL